MADGKLYPTENAYFVNRLRQINQQRDLGLQSNNYEKALGSQQYQWDRTDLLKRLSDQRAALPGSYTRRGLIGNSGIYQRGLTDFTSQSNDAKSRLGTAWNLKQFGYGMTQGQLNSVAEESKNQLKRQQDALREMRAMSALGVQ